MKKQDILRPFKIHLIYHISGIYLVHICYTVHDPDLEKYSCGLVRCWLSSAREKPQRRWLRDLSEIERFQLKMSVVSCLSVLFIVYAWLSLYLFDDLFDLFRGFMLSKASHEPCMPAASLRVAALSDSQPLGPWSLHLVGSGHLGTAQVRNRWRPACGSSVLPLKAFWDGKSRSMCRPQLWDPVVLKPAYPIVAINNVPHMDIYNDLII